MTQPTAKDVLERLRLSTNINNTNNTNNTNNLTTSIIVRKTDNQVEENPSSTSVGLASLSARPLALPTEIHFESGSELPAAWLNFKWDLFKNPNGLKLACNIIKLDGSKQNLTASLNSPHDRLWRKVEDRTTQHWQLVQEQYDLWRSVIGKELSDFRTSKLCLPGKKGSVEICVFMAETELHYAVRMLYRAKVYDYNIPKASIEHLSVKQLTSNQIATLFVGKKAQAFVSLDDLGI